jgi:acyl-CoA thioesterase
VTSDFTLLQEGEEPRSCPEGEASFWSIDDPRGATGPSASWHSPDTTREDGRDVLRTFTDPSVGLEQLLEYGAFDAERVRVEVADQVGDDEQGSTVKRVPTWGEARHLIDLLDVRRDGDHSFTSTARSDPRRPVVEGSQMLGQAIVAAGRLAPDRRVVSANMVFLRPADAGRPLRFELAELSAGRAFSTVAVQVLQEDRRCAAGTLLLGIVAPEVIRHAVEPPGVPGPYDSPPYDMGVTGRDVRIVDGAYSNDSEAAVGPPTVDAWVRFREVPDDPVLHAGLLAQFTGHMSIAAALRPHAGVGQDQAHRTLSMGINAISLSLHREAHADHWLLYHHLSTFAGDGMTHSECRVHDEAGELVASFTVDAMVRPFPGSTTDKLDERTAL